MKKNKIAFFVVEFLLLVVALIGVWKIFNQDVPEKRVAVILPEVGDNRWDSMIKGMKQSAEKNHIHLIICNTDEVESTEVEKEIIKEQQNNHIDAFLVWPAAGKETEEMLKEECANIPVILLVENVYNDSILKSDTFSKIGPDFYEMGSILAEKISSTGGSIGIVAGKKESEASVSAVQGFMETLGQTGSQVKWCYYQTEGTDVFDEINSNPDVDHLVVLDSGMLDKIGDDVENNSYNGSKIWGIGFGVKSIAMVDYGKIEGLVVPDGYEIGYKSVEAMAGKLRNNFDIIENTEITIKMLQKDDMLLDEDTERFLYSYE